MRYILLLLLFVNAASIVAQDTATVMFYNLLQFPNQKPERISYLKTIIQEVKPDVFMVCELTNNTGSVTILTQALNTGAINYYQRATFWDDGSLNNMLYYNTRKYKLLKQDTIACVPRFATVYTLLHKNAVANGDSILSTYIVVHLKAGNSDQIARKKAAQKIRYYIDNKTKGENIFLAGDFNIYSPTEGAFETFTKKGANKLYDPINEIGEWSNKEYYAPIHTQSTRTQSFGGGSTGGLDDRFDWIMTTNDVNDGSNKIEYVLGSYKAYGNDGKHFNSAVNFKENSAVSKEIADALHEMSDHLPVVMKVAYSYTNSVENTIQVQPKIIKDNSSLILRNIQDFKYIQIMDLQGRILEQQINNSNLNELRFSGLKVGQLLIVSCFNEREVFTTKVLL